LQFLLNLSDRQAAEAVRCRTDSTYALAMDLDDPGLHHSVLTTSVTASAGTTAPTGSCPWLWTGYVRPE
jgi:hypothetical protein